MRNNRLRPPHVEKYLRTPFLESIQVPFLVRRRVLPYGWIGKFANHLIEKFGIGRGETLDMLLHVHEELQGCSAGERKEAKGISLEQPQRFPFDQKRIDLMIEGNNDRLSATRFNGKQEQKGR